MDLAAYPYDLSTYRYPVSTDQGEAQAWFDRGLAWTFGFNHVEAIACFERALACDPGCAMAHWGIGYAAGPNYNMPWERMDEAGRAEALARGYDAVQAGLECLGGATAPERALVEALAARYPERAPAADMTLWDRAFADAMGRALAAHPDDLTIRSVAVEALMQLSPWALWDLQTGAPAEGAETEACRALLEHAFEADPAAWAHPGLLHLYVHLMEMSPMPERALPMADRLRDLVPDAGHLVHMASHIDVQVGAYQDVLYWNRRAVVADELFFEREGAFNLYTGYRQHNYHFVIYGAMMLGQMAPALEAAAGIAATTPEDLLRIESPPMADYFEAYLAFQPHILVRFGQWEAAKRLEVPADPVLFATQTAHVHYARTIAFAATGEVDAALEEEVRFLGACAAVPETRLLHNNTVRDLLAVGQAMARGEILYRQGALDAAFAALRLAVAREDALAYDEPWGWMQPSRHALGALLLEAGHVEEAAQVFREDLGLVAGAPRAQRHPDNVWALRGLSECLAQGENTPEQAWIEQRLAVSLARADGTVGAACFCAQAAMACDQRGRTI